MLTTVALAGTGMGLVKMDSYQPTLLAETAAQMRKFANFVVG